jgi:hypothetical protein
VLDGESEGSAFHGVPVLARDATLPPVDAVIVTDLTDAQRTFDALSRRLPNVPILAPKMLRVARRAVEEAAE